MLARAARSLRQPYRYTSASSEQLLLHRVRSGQIRCTFTVSSRPRTLSAGRTGRRLSLDGGQRHDRRAVATASAYQPGIDPIPFLYPASTSQQHSSQPYPSRSTLQPWDPSQPLMLGESRWEQLPKRPRTLGVGGDITELFQNLHACIRVDRTDRAENIIRSIAEFVGPSAAELRYAHEMYIRSLVEDLESAETLQPRDIMHVQKWFERDMRPTCMPSGDTYALMCRAALAVQSGAQRDRTLRRYLVQASRDGLYEDTIDSGELTDAQADTLELVYSGRSADRLLAALQETSDELQSTLSFHRENTGRNFHVQSVEQKGSGLSTLKATLQQVDPSAVEYPHFESLTNKEKELLWANRRQENIERSVADEALRRWREEHEQMLKMGISTALKTKPMAALLWQWHQGLEPLVEAELKSIKQGLESPKQHQHSRDREFEESIRQKYGPYVEALSAEQLSALTIIQTMRTVATSGVAEPVKLSAITTSLGNALEREAQMKRQFKTRNQNKGRNGLAESKSATETSTTNSSEAGLTTTSHADTDYMKRMIRQHGESWPSDVRHWIAAQLISKFLDVAKIVVKTEDGESAEEPALKHESIYQHGKRRGVVSAHRGLQEMLMRDPVRGVLGAQLPMVVEPRPWTGYKDGGYLLQQTDVVRAKENSDTQKLYTMAAAEKGDLAQPLDALNVLGKVPWRINQDVFKVMVEAWNSGEAIADIAPAHPNLSYPPEPADMTDRAARQAWLQRKQAIDNEKAGLHSQRCMQNFQVEIARTYLDETFYCPHNMDFRGRVYPIPPYLNHMGPDFTRGLMIFANGKPLGETGLKWLKIHLANVSGYDKASLQEREAFAMEHLDDIRDSVENPLTGRKWWLKAEDPWQCLATCFEVKNAMDSTNPEQFISHMPIHQDGTCNGLQHYAALGGDTMGAQQVNLEPGDRPADIYSAVAHLVIAEIDKDAEAGDVKALKLQGKITRKVVKQTVMTNVYGVTFVGARAQVQKQLDDILLNDHNNPETNNYRLSAYIAHKIFGALGTMFTGAQNIQRWLGTCADRITSAITPEQLELIARRESGNDTDVIGPKISTKVKLFVRKAGKPAKLTDEFRSCVVWTTPLKMPVVQPYRSSRIRAVRTIMQDITLREPRLNDPVSKRKQLQAFPPNFVHSLDATHMMLSALKCNELGLTFASVHDSFWTHAVDIPVMNHVLRDAFVLMHSEDIIGRLAAEFKARYKNSIYLSYVNARSPVGKAIAQLRKQKTSKAVKIDPNSKNGMNELLEEHKRQKLLRSKDPEKRKAGRAMVTPASVFEAAKDAEAFQPPTSLGATELGAISEQQASALDAEEAGAADDVVADADAETEAVADPRALDNSAEAVDYTAASKADAQKKHKKSRANNRPEPRLALWLPLTFPDVPAKGDFDVRRLRESQYFFS